MIPARLFIALLDELPTLDAQAQLRTTLAVQLGAAGAIAGKDPKIRNQFRALERRADGRWGRG